MHSQMLTGPKFHLNNSSGSGITEKVRRGREKWFIPTYTLKGCISQKGVVYIILFRDNTENAKIYWVLKKYIENLVIIRYFTVKFAQLSGNFSRNYVILLLQFFISHGCTINKWFLQLKDTKFVVSSIKLGNNDVSKEPYSWAVDKFFVCLKEIFNPFIVSFTSLLINNLIVCLLVCLTKIHFL